MKPLVACLNIRSRRDGAAMLATVVGMVLILGIYTAGVFAYVETQRRAVANQVDIEQAFTVAEAGVERAAAYIEQHHGIVVTSVPVNGSLNYGTSTTITNQYRAVIIPLREEHPGDFKISCTGTIFRTTWTGNPMSVSRVVAINRVWLPSWSKYTMWSHDNNKISFITGEVISGAVHADNQIYFAGNPRFTNSLVTSATNNWYAAATINDTAILKGSLSNVRFDPNFGFKTNTSGGTLANVPFDDLETLAGSLPNGIVLPSSTRIDFLTNSTVISTNAISTIATNFITTKLVNAKLVTTTNWYYPTNWYPQIDTNMTQLIYVQGEAYVAGSSNGVRATVIAEGDIHITNSLIYASWTNKTMTGTQWEAYTSGDDTNLTEALGLISKSNIWVDTSCPTNMSVFAHVMATGTNCGFGAASYDARKTGALTLFGGIVQYKRAAVGVGTNGFKKFYTYDTRFAINPPPYYPVQSETINYEQWEEHAP